MVLLAMILALAGGAAADCPDLDFEDFDVPPAMVDAVTPVFPQMAILAGMGGEVLVKVRLRADGEVCDVEVMESCHPVMDREAVKAARNSRFKPASRNGHAVPGAMELLYDFHFEFTSVEDFDDEDRLILGAPPYIFGPVFEGPLLYSFRINRWAWPNPALDFRGDISVEKYRDAMAELEEHLEEGETFSLFTTRLLQLSVNGLKLHRELAIEVRTCEGRSYRGRCHGGRIFQLDGEDLTYEDTRLFQGWSN